MAINNLKELFEKNEEEYLKFHNVHAKLSNRPDLHAFMLLDRLVPSMKQRDMISASEHDQIWLDVEPDVLAERATEEDIVDLIRCGVMYEEENESFSMFA